MMSGNEVGDRVHNFFAQENFFGTKMHNSAQFHDNMNFFGGQQRGVSDQTPNSLFGGQQHQMNSQPPGFLQPLAHQQASLVDIQHLQRQQQQQLMLKKMQELRRQKEIQQLNQSSLFAKQTSVPRSDLIPLSESSWPEIPTSNMNWLQRSMQPVDQSLYGVQVSNSMSLLNKTSTFPNSNSWINMEQVQTYPQDLINMPELALNEQEQPAIEASLDPEEEKILFGSDVNIWDAFGSDKESISLNDDEFANGLPLPSIQSGSWSALMQSAVAETTSTSGGSFQEELTTLTLQNIENENSLQHSQMGSPQINVEHFTATHNLSNMQQSGGHFGQFPSNNHQLGYWKHVSESSLNNTNNSSDSRSIRENSNESYQSTSSRQLTLTSGQRKFQYHPGYPNTSLPSQNTFELLHKVDHSKDDVTTRLSSSLEQHKLSSEIPQQQYPNVSLGGHQRTHSSNSQGFNFQLCPPSQSLLPLPDDSLSQTHKGSQTQVVFPSFQETPHGGFKNNSFDQKSKSQLQNPQTVNCSQLNIVESTSLPNFGATSCLNPHILSTKVDLDQGQSQTTTGPSVNPVTTTSNQMDLEAFGRSLKPYSFLQNYSVMDNDPCNRATKRLKSGQSQNESQSWLPSNITPSTKECNEKSEKQRLKPAGVHPWLLEVSGNFKNLQSICTGAVEWSTAANQLMEKVDDDGDVIEQQITKPKKRLILTTLLMQQLLRPPPGTILSFDVTLNYESVVYYAARLALGDACNLLSYAKANCDSDKSKQCEKVDNHRLVNVIEDFTSKAKKLEDDFLRADKKASMLDLRMESQEVERFSFINRFARYYGRMQQSDAALTLSSSNSPKPSPYRFVTAVAFPANLPDSLTQQQCLSL